MLVDFFRNKGLAAIKEEDRREDWYQDWLDYQARHRLYASVLSPEKCSSFGCHFCLAKLTRFLETFAYFSPAHAYSLHVSFLGLFPILVSSNEELKKEAVRKLEEGGLFAFAISEQAHGSDLLANEFTVQPAGPDEFQADGVKYYIGNVNAASMISVLAKKVERGPAATAKRSPLLLFALRPQETPAFGNLRKIRTLGVRAAFVGEFAVEGHRFGERDVIARGRDSWEAIFATIGFGKFFLGFGAVGICAHAFAETIAHTTRRILYGKPVSDMPHIRSALVSAFARLTAMKLYAYRALDYLQAAGPGERRYLLWCAVQKARVSTEGVKVMALLSECIGARGFEAETYFEMALRDAQLIPALESSTHINFGLTAQFIDSYFAESASEIVPPPAFLHETNRAENPYWFEAGDRNAKTVGFAHFLDSYKPLQAVPNVNCFMEQAKAFRQLLAGGGISTLNPSGDAELNVEMGKCFSLIAYAQLVAENSVAAKLPSSLVSLIFHGLVEDLSAAALKLAALFPAGSAQRGLLHGLVRVPETAGADVAAVAELIRTRYLALPEWTGGG